MAQETTRDLIEAIESALPWQLHEVGEATGTARKVLDILGPVLAENERLRAELDAIGDMAYGCAPHSALAGQTLTKIHARAKSAAKEQAR